MTPGPQHSPLRSTRVPTRGVILVHVPATATESCSATGASSPPGRGITHITIHILLHRYFNPRVSHGKVVNLHREVKIQWSLNPWIEQLSSEISCPGQLVWPAAVNHCSVIMSRDLAQGKSWAEAVVMALVDQWEKAE